jgi:hypothetical protein
MPGQHTTNVIEGHANKGKKGNRSGLLQWIQGPPDLPVTVAVPLESVLQSSARPVVTSRSH